MNINLVDQIRQQLSQPDGITHETMQPLADEYSVEAMEVNARLLESIQLLRKGQRSEAIQLANSKPNVLEWSARLDFVELDEWIDILQFLGITPPPVIHRDAAQQLQEAIVEEQPLEELLRQQRKLAIANAPLSWRLKVLKLSIRPTVSGLMTFATGKQNVSSKYQVSSRKPARAAIWINLPLYPMNSLWVVGSSLPKKNSFNRQDANGRKCSSLPNLWNYPRSKND
jgi:hypothetical protein